ncbi:amidohydrolase family protein [Mycolicibacterium gadium]|uniref:Amidohydrolase n=1 Tax=Mycolicibacterium gadium TaxID=1794 RepID=A0ABT6GIK8_MYCGU|nr:amidohydrolase family protein [Mycolicibacterium gadium]MDG5481218.1 amidohydrolase [Mycolicibacterium gadium]
MVDPSDLVLISVDDHTVEPPDMFAGRVPARYADDAPRIVEDADGSVAWVYDGMKLPNIGLNAVAGRPNDEWGFEPSRFEDMRKGCYDVDARVEDMNACGVLASVCFPSFPTISGALFTYRGEREVSAVMVKTYNDWHIEDWCGAHPDRFIPMGILPLWDPCQSASEVRRLASLGCRAVTVPQHVGNYGQPPWQDPHWDVLWEAICENNTVVNIHIGTGGGMPVPSDQTSYLAYNSMLALDTGRFTADLLFSRVVKEFPTIKFALSEGGIGWIPFLLERFEDIYGRQRAWTGDDLGDGNTPTDVFRRNFFSCFIRDRVGIENRHRIGIETICWEMDYPHSDSSWPDAPEQLAEELEGCSHDEIEAISWRNAANAFGYSGVERLGREACTVAALRAKVADKDLSTPKVDVDRIPKPGIQALTYGEMRKRMATIMTGGTSSS